MRYFDEKVGAWCRVRQITYTRYCDDMTFSGDFNAASVTGYVRHMLRKQGFELNERKTKCVSSSQQQNVTGIVVNEKLQVSAETRRKLRQEVYYCQKYGVSDCVRRIGTPLSEKEYLESLRGRISFALQVNHEDQKMQECFAQVQEMVETKHFLTFEELSSKAETAETLDELFDLWKLAHKTEGKAYIETTTPPRGKHPAIEQTSFVADGYVSGNSNDYENANRKVLFILFLFPFVTFEDDFLRTIQLWMIGSEIEQAVGRARLVRHDCNVHLYSNFPIRQGVLKNTE